MARRKQAAADPGTGDLLAPAAERPSPAPAAPLPEAAAAPSILEYTPAGQLDKWRVEQFDLLVAEFSLTPNAAPGTEGYEQAMSWLQQVAEGYPRGWLILRRLFGIAPMIPRADAHPDELRSFSRAELGELLGIGNKDLQAELDAVRGMLASSEKPEEATPEAPAEKLKFDEDVLEEFGFSERMFDVLTWDPISRTEQLRASAENRLEKQWFTKRVKDWAKMLREPMGSALARRALMNELDLRRFDNEMSRLSPTTRKYQELRADRTALENQYQKQLMELQDMFPEMNIAGKLSFQAVMSDLIKGYRDYKARQDTKLLDRIRTGSEIEVELRQSKQAPEPRYRMGLNLAIVEAMHNLYDPDFRSQFRQPTLRKLDVAFKKAVEEVRASTNEKLVDLESGVMPGEGEEYADIPAAE